MSTQVVVKTLGMLKRMFDYVFIDTAPFLDEPVLSILERSDTVLLVVDMDLPAVKNAKLALDTLKLIKFPSRRSSWSSTESTPRQGSISTSLSELSGSRCRLPFRQTSSCRAVNEGEPVVSLYPRSRPAKDLRGVAALVLREIR